MNLSLFLISSVLILYCRPNFDRSLLEILFFRQQSQNSSIPNPATSPTVSSSKDITFYSIPSLGLNGIIAGTQISLTSDTLTAFTPLIAQFITTGKSVTVSGISQVSNVTANSYSSNLIYTVTAEDGSTKDFTVTLTAPRAYAGASLVIWLKADSLGLSDGTAVSNWNDLSGYGNHYTQATAGLRPTYRVNQINGLPSVQFRFSLTQKYHCRRNKSVYK
ncbi:MAG TPA: hypothetical protein PLJ29_11235 [Leptospiraceae bacterium]|nr:hypothetical protein [Leptospiraceae bacterium]HMY66375.1 hypothetical protein [Leptospiraceae bacterium]HNF23834.1 hypothetical protein [Leptospiraceae bacterium]HNH08071.1 hypothetical protein [Leptospiraceae bacterium]HNI26925.1 hypothetical protein [Leptospiraceae bacterium]